MDREKNTRSFVVEVLVRFKPSIVEPQGKAVLLTAQDLGWKNVEKIRIGKLIEIFLQASSLEEVKEEIQKLADKLLYNPVIEEYRILSIEECK